MTSPERRNFAEIARLERLLRDLRAEAGTARETEAIREIGLEIALAVREVGAMLTDVGWEQALGGPGHESTSSGSSPDRKESDGAGEEADLVREADPRPGAR